MHMRPLVSCHARLRSVLLRSWWLALLAAPAFAHAPVHRAAAALRAPVTPACISSPYGKRVLPNRPLAGTFHNGIDLPAPAGASVHAVAAGRVIRAQRRGPGGLELLVQHHGFVGVYSHLGAISPTIAQGHFQVRAGQKLGVVGHSGVTYGMHLFFAMERHGKFLDPASYLDIALCHPGLRHRSDMLASDGKIPPTRHFGTRVPHSLYARK